MKKPMQSASIRKAISTARKRLKFMPEKQQNQNLEFACDSMAEAYRLGAEEAQTEIVSRLRDLLPSKEGAKP